MHAIKAATTRIVAVFNPEPSPEAAKAYYTFKAWQREARRYGRLKPHDYCRSQTCVMHAGIKLNQENRSQWELDKHIAKAAKTITASKRRPKTTRPGRKTKSPMRPKSAPLSVA